MDLTHYSHKENEMKTDGGVMTNETKSMRKRMEEWQEQFSR